MLTGLLSGLPQPAHALTGVPPTIVENSGAVRQFLYRNSAIAQPCSATCSELWLAEHRPMPNQASSKALHAELAKALEKRALMPTGRSIAVNLGSKVLPALGSLSLGWVIGSGINAKWMGGDGFGGAGANPGNYCVNSCVQSLQPAPADGTAITGSNPTMTYPTGAAWVWSFSLSSNVNYLRQVPDGPGNNCDFDPEIPPQFTIVNGFQTTRCNAGPGSAVQAGYMTLEKALKSGSKPAPIEDYTDQPSQGTLSAPTDPGATAVESALKIDLTVENYPTLAPWLDYQLGGTSPNPIPTVYVAVPAIEVGQTYPQYLKALQAVGLVGTAITLTDATTSTAHGPGEVVSAAPAAGTQVAVGTTVKVKVNPETAAEPTTGGGGGGSPTIHAIDLGPLSVEGVCTTFPFGVPCWLLGAMGGWSGGGNCPALDFPLPFGLDVDLDLCGAEAMVGVVRPVLLMGSLLGLGWLFMGAAMGFGGRGDDD